MHKALLAIGLAFAVTTLARSADMQTIAYPTKDEASFLITAPEDWEIKQAEEGGDYFHLLGPTGAVFSFRTIEGGEDSLKEAIAACIKDISKRFDDVDLGDAKDWTPHGLEGFYAVGSAKEKEDGTPIRVGVGWCVLKDGNIAELWFVADEDDEKGINLANDIANSLEAP